MRISRAIFFVFYILICLAVILALVEIALRFGLIKNSFTQALLENKWQESGYIYTHPALSEVKVTNEKGENNTFKTDRFGLNNDDSVYSNKDANVLVLGDSFVEASTILRRESLVSFLNEAAIDSNQGAIFINAGVDGYSNWQSFFLLDSLFGKIKPKIVILFVYLGNDLRDNYALKQQASLLMKDLSKGIAKVDNKESGRDKRTVMRRRIKSFIRNNLVEKSYVLKIIYAYIAGINQRINPAVDYDYFCIEAYRNKPNKNIAQAVENTDFILSCFKDYCGQRKVKFIVFAIPSKREVYNDFFYTSLRMKNMAIDVLRDQNGYSFDNPAKYYNRICKDLNIPFFDMTGLFKSYPGYEMFGSVDFHWSSLAQSRAASYVFDILSRNKYLAND